MEERRKISYYFRLNVIVLIYKRSYEERQHLIKIWLTKMRE